MSPEVERGLRSYVVGSPEGRQPAVETVGKHFEDNEKTPSGVTLGPQLHEVR